MNLKDFNNNNIIFLDIKINFETRNFIKNWEKIKITTKEYLIFKYLYENKNKVCTRSDLIEYVLWSDSLFDDDSKLDVYVSNLRKKLDKKLIETVKWVWYKLWSIN